MPTNLPVIVFFSISVLLSGVAFLPQLSHWYTRVPWAKPALFWFLKVHDDQELERVWSRDPLQVHPNPVG